jgi:hypothetical protein
MIQYRTGDRSYLVASQNLLSLRPVIRQDLTAYLGEDLGNVPSAK